MGERKKRRRRRKKEEEKKKKSRFGTLELWLGTSLLFGTLIFVSMEPICMDLLVRKPS